MVGGEKKTADLNIIISFTENRQRENRSGPADIDILDHRRRYSFCLPGNLPRKELLLRLGETNDIRLNVKLHGLCLLRMTTMAETKRRTYTLCGYRFRTRGGSSLLRFFKFIFTEPIRVQSLGRHCTSANLSIAKIHVDGDVTFVCRTALLDPDLHLLSIKGSRLPFVSASCRQLTLEKLWTTSLVRKRYRPSYWIESQQLGCKRQIAVIHCVTCRNSSFTTYKSIDEQQCTMCTLTHVEAPPNQLTISLPNARVIFRSIQPTKHSSTWLLCVTFSKWRALDDFQAISDRSCEWAGGGECNWSWELTDRPGHPASVCCGSSWRTFINGWKPMLGRSWE